MQEKITIERLAYGDAGIGHAANGKTVFVNGTCPGDVVLADLARDKGSYFEADLLEVAETSPHRVALTCPFADTCGGCGWQHIAYETQLEAKRENVVSQLARTGGFDAAHAEEAVGACMPSKRQFGYRNKLEFSCSHSDARGFQMGFHRKGSTEIVSPDTCPLALKGIEKSPKALRGALRYLHGSSDLDIFRVGVRMSNRTGACEVALWTNPGPFPRAAVAKTLSTALKTSSIVRVMTADKGKERKLKGVEILAGKGFWTEKVCDEEFSVSAPSFFQVNTAQAEKLVKLAIEGLELDEECVAADLYCGVGTFTLPMARVCDTVFAVESYGSSVRDLRRIAEYEGLDNIEVIGGDAARELPELGQLDALVVDPPRAGLAAEIIGSIAQAAPRKLAYVSCNPSTWARDVKRLTEAGFELVSAIPVDLFPQTYHVEVVSIFKNVND